MWHRAQNNTGIRIGHTQQDPLQKMHRHLAWALSIATIILVINALVVVALFEAG